jgi:hypothetical protein
MEFIRKVLIYTRTCLQAALMEAFMPLFAVVVAMSILGLTYEVIPVIVLVYLIYVSWLLIVDGPDIWADLFDEPELEEE